MIDYSKFIASLSRLSPTESPFEGPVKREWVLRRKQVVEWALSILNDQEGQLARVLLLDILEELEAFHVEPEPELERLQAENEWLHKHLDEMNAGGAKAFADFCDAMAKSVE